jgi:integrase
MAKTLNKLTATQVESAGSGLHGDGGNLYLRVTNDLTRSWLFIYRFGGKQRETAAEGRALLNQRPPVDPLTVWRPTPEATAPTFAKAAADYIALHGPGWKNSKHHQQWVNTIANYCKPIHAMRVDTIGAENVLACLLPIWRNAPETASRLRGRIEIILDFAKSDDETRPNPARWKGHLANKLPNPQEIGKRVKRDGVVKIVDRGHFAALPYADVPNFIAKLQAIDGVAARALEFTILCGSRTNEVLGAVWSEIDLEAGTWTIPPERLKTGKKVRKPHIVPVLARAIAIINEMAALKSSDFVFNGRFDAAPLSNMTMLKLLRSIAGHGLTVHGFRSAFRDWCGDETSFPREVAEAALGHVVGGVEGAYRRSDALAKRRALMTAWEAFCTPPEDGAASNVVRFG